MSPADYDWETLREQWERLTWARVRWQRANGAIPVRKDAAESLGMRESTYAQYERPPRSSRSAELTLGLAQEFARKFKVDWVWLMTGRGSPYHNDDVERISLLISRADEDTLALLENMAKTLIHRLPKSA